MKVIYIDVLFAVGAMTAFVLLSLTAFLTGSYLGKIRHISASILSGLFSVGSFFAPFGAAAGLLCKAVMCAAIVAVAFKGQRGRYIRLCGVFFLATLFTAGMMYALSFMGFGVEVQGGSVYIEVGFFELALAFAASYAAAALAMGKGGFVKKNMIVPVKLGIFGKELSFSAMVDTGNRVFEPVTKKAVILVSPDILKDVFPENMGDKRIYPIRVETAGQPFMIYALEPERLEIDGNERKDCMVAAAASPIEGVQGCKAIIGGEA